MELGLSVEMEISGRALAGGYYLGSGGLVVQCPEPGSPTSEAQARQLAGAPRPCQPHGFWEVLRLLPAFSSYSAQVVPHVDVFFDIFVERKVSSMSYSSAILKVLSLYTSCC